MTYDAIRFERRGPAAWITLARPERRNAIGPRMTAEIHHAIEAAESDAEVRVVVFAGEGKGFSAGGDLGGMDDRAAEIPGRRFSELLSKVASATKPTVARVHGAAMGGGLGLACACHVVLAATDAKLGTPEIDHGLFPMMIMAVLLRHAPRRKVLEMMLTGGRIDGTTAETWGLVTRAVPPEALDAEVDRVVAALASKSPAAMRIGLEAYRAQMDRPLDEALGSLEEALARVLATEDAREGIAAFLEKRTPVWKGQ